MESDPASSLGPPGRAEVAEGPDGGVEELIEGKMEGVEEVEGEDQLDGEVDGGVQGEGGVSEKEGDGEELGREEVVKKDDEHCAPKAEVAHEGSKKCEDNGSFIKLVSSTPQKTENNLSSSSQTRQSFRNKCIISSKEFVLPNSKVVNRNIGKQKHVKNARHDKASYSEANVILRKRNLDCVVHPSDRLNEIGRQTPNCFDAPSTQTVPRRPMGSSLGMDEAALKKTAIICDFFAKGWCIKGNSCRFLHTKNEAAVDGSMSEVGISKQPASYELLDSGRDERSKDLSVRQRALVRAYGGEFRDLTKTFSENCQGTLGTRSYHNSDFNGRLSNEEYQNQQYLKEGASYQEVQRGDTHDAPSSGFSSLARSSAFFSRNDHSEGSSIVSDPYHSGNINYSNGNRPGDYKTQYGQHSYPPYEYRSYSLTSSMDSSYTNPLSSLHSSPSVHAFSQPVIPIHNSTILGSEHGNIQRIDHDKAHYGSSYIPMISSYDSRSSEKGISGLAPPFIEQKSTMLEHTWETSVPFQSSFCNTSLIKSFPDCQLDPPGVGVEPPNLVETSISHRSHNKMDEYVIGDHSSENITTGHWELKPSDSFSNRSYEDVLDKTTFHGFGSYSSMMSASQNGFTHEVEISIGENETHQICCPHDLSIKEKDTGSKVRNVDKSYNMEPRALRIFRVALVKFVKELVKPAWNDGHISKDAHKIVVKKSVEKVLSTFQLHEVPSNEESIHNYLSTSHPKITKLVEAYMAKYAMVSSAEDFKPL